MIWIGGGQGCTTIVHSNQRAGSSAHIQQFCSVFHVPCSDSRPKLPSQSLGRPYMYALSRASAWPFMHGARSPCPRNEGTYILFSRPLKGASQVFLSPVLIHSCCWLVRLVVESPPRWWTSVVAMLSSFPFSSPSDFLCRSKSLQYSSLLLKLVPNARLPCLLSVNRVLVPKRV
jgi:hypothetical protein